ncbi:MAG: aminotransferase class I/II-fold pyridoxal phosphate-dependent enzyme [Candidatus Hodarchaeota archaeon]
MMEMKAGHLAYRRTPIEKESPEEFGYERINYNLAESSVPDFILGNLNIDLTDLALSYTDHLGNPQLRQYIAGEEVSPEHVLTTTGAAGALFIINTSLLKPSDHVVIVHPNYVANLESPRAIGCQVEYLRLVIEDRFRFNLEKLEELIQPNTRLISLTYPQNPTGTMITESQLEEIISIVEARGIYLLFDETYREMTSDPLPIVGSLSENAISVSSFSKAYGLPGIRIGWLISQNSELMERFLAGKELIFICNSIVDEEIAAHFLARREEFLSKVNLHVTANQEVLTKWMEKSSYMEWVRPSGGVICFPRIKPSINIDIENFYEVLKMKYKTFVAPGHWFEVDKRFMRIGYGYPSKQELKGGLQCITDAIKDCVD